MPGATENRLPSERARTWLDHPRFGSGPKKDDSGRGGPPSATNAMLKGEGQVITGWKKTKLAGLPLPTVTPPPKTLAQKHRDMAETGIRPPAESSGSGIRRYLAREEEHGKAKEKRIDNERPPPELAASLVGLAAAVGCAGRSPQQDVEEVVRMKNPVNGNTPTHPFPRQQAGVAGTGRPGDDGRALIMAKRSYKGSGRLAGAQGAGDRRRLRAIGAGRALNRLSPAKGRPGRPLSIICRAGGGRRRRDVVKLIECGRAQGGAATRRHPRKRALLPGRLVAEAVRQLGGLDILGEQWRPGQNHGTIRSFGTSPPSSSTPLSRTTRFMRCFWIIKAAIFRILKPGALHHQHRVGQRL